MPLVSESWALIIFAIIIILSIIIALYLQDYQYFDKTWFHSFIVILTGLGIIIVFLFYYNVLILQGQQQQLAAIQEISRINDSVLNSMLDSMQRASAIIPNFVLSITPLTNNVCCVTSNTGTTGCVITVDSDPVNPQTCTEKMVLSYRIFSLWQDIIEESCIITYDAVAYVSNFLQRANSQQLYAQWTASKLNFNNKTQAFGDLLFEYGLPITNQTPATYTQTANLLITDPRYKSIFI